MGLEILRLVCLVTARSKLDERKRVENRTREHAPAAWSANLSSASGNAIALGMPYGTDDLGCALVPAANTRLLGAYTGDDDHGKQSRNAASNGVKNNPTRYG